MGRVHFHYDSKPHSNTLTVLDIEIGAVVIDLALLGSLAREHGSSRPLLEYYVDEMSANVERLSYVNPFDLYAVFNALTQAPVNWLLQRVLFYKQESELRQVNADMTREEVIKRKLENLSSAHDLRKRMLEDGSDPETAARTIGRILVDQKADLNRADRGSISNSNF
jgi:hypothetical protein